MVTNPLAESKRKSFQKTNPRYIGAVWQYGLHVFSVAFRTCEMVKQPTLHRKVPPDAPEERSKPCLTADLNSFSDGFMEHQLDLHVYLMAKAAVLLMTLRKSG